MAEPGQPGRKLALWIRSALWILVLALAGISIRQALLLSLRGKQIAEGASENQRLHRQVEQLTQAATQPKAPPPLAPAAPASHPAIHIAQGMAGVITEEQAADLQHGLAVAHADVAKLEARVADLQSQVDTLAAENRRLAAAGEDLKRAFADANQTIETVRAEQKTSTARMAKLEAANARLEAESAASTESAVQLHQLAMDLEGTFRRREMYLNNILRRYKEVTEQYRALAGVRDNRDHATSPVTGAEISRIQNIIALAEEDLKQIQALSVQTARLQKKLPQK